MVMCCAVMAFTCRHVWESDFHTSFDGRWILAIWLSYAGPPLDRFDRKNLRAWVLSVSEAGQVDDLHWRLPHWSGEGAGGNGVAAEGHHVLQKPILKRGSIKTWGPKRRPWWVSVDLWIPADCARLRRRKLCPRNIPARQCRGASEARHAPSAAITAGARKSLRAFAPSVTGNCS